MSAPEAPSELARRHGDLVVADIRAVSDAPFSLDDDAMGGVSVFLESEERDPETGLFSCVYVTLHNRGASLLVMDSCAPGSRVRVVDFDVEDASARVAAVRLALEFVGRPTRGAP